MADLYEKLKRFQKNTDSGLAKPADALSPSKPTVPEAPLSSEKKALAEALLHIPGVQRARELLQMTQRRDEEKKRFLLDLEVQESRNEQGSFGLREISYPLDTLPCDPGDIAGEQIFGLCRDARMTAVDCSGLLFLDTETTGLAGGTGTYPFLVGAGFFTQDDFTVRQFFMRDFDDEPAMLVEIQRLLERYPIIVSYNGKAFDAPLLQSRFLLNRIRLSLTDLPHWDLLYAARRFWREMLPNCRLSTVEAEIFGHRRDEDVPSEMIPYIYFDFLRGLRMERMRPVLAHNAEDIRSLALIAARVCRMLREPDRECRHAMELVGLGNFYANQGEFTQATALYEIALQRPEIALDHRYLVHRRISLLYKRQGLFQHAAQVWKCMVEEHEDCFAYIELAKFWEHRERRFEEALRITEEVLSRVQRGQAHISSDWQSDRHLLQELTHRRARLLRRLGRGEEDFPAGVCTS